MTATTEKRIMSVERTLIRMDGGEVFTTGVPYERLMKQLILARGRPGQEVRFMRVSCEGRVLWFNPRQIIYLKRVHDGQG